MKLPKASGMNSSVELQGVDIRIQGIEEILAQTLPLSFVEANTAAQIREC